MRRELLIAFTAFFFMSLSALTGVYAVEEKAKIETLLTKQVDVTGDAKKDTIYLRGNPYEDGTLFLKEIYLDIAATDGKTYKINLEGGYEPAIHFIDLNNDEVKDIYIGIPTGDSGGISNYFLYTLKDSSVTDLTPPEPLVIESQFKDGYQASLTIQETGQSYSFDLSDRGKDYERMGLYLNGKLNEPSELMVLPYGTLKPVKVSGNKYGLKGIQRLSGVFNADSIAYVESTWFFEKGKWILQDVSVEKIVPSKNQ